MELNSEIIFRDLRTVKVCEILSKNDKNMIENCDKCSIKKVFAMKTKNRNFNKFYKFQSK